MPGGNGQVPFSFQERGEKGRQVKKVRYLFSRSAVRIANHPAEKRTTRKRSEKVPDTFSFTPLHLFPLCDTFSL